MLTPAHKPSRPGKFSGQNNQTDWNNDRARSGKKHERDAKQNDRASNEADDDSSQSLRQSIKADTFPKIPGPLHTSLYRTSAMLQLRGEVRQFLTELRRDMGNNDCIVAFVLKLEHVTDSVNLRN